MWALSPDTTAQAHELASDVYYYRECARVGHAQYIEPSRAHADLIVRGDADWQRLRPLLVAVIAAQLADR
jgi:uridine kinase